MTDIFVSRQDDQRQTEIALSLLPMFEGKRAFVRTFGCQQNESDGEKLMGYLMLCGFSRATSESDADLILINTCAIREHAEKRELSYAGQLKKLKANKKDLIIGICGCMPQQLHRVEQIKKSYPYVDFAFGTDMNHRLPEILYSVVNGTKRMFFINDLPHDSFGVISEGMPVCRASSYKAWVSIMYGCNNFCTYCIVPYVRGRERSRTPEDILSEIKCLVKSGTTEISLLGQNVNSYGKDLGLDIDFADLLKMINDIDGVKRIRFMTSHPKDLSDKLIYTIRDCDKVCKQLHLPVQAGSNRILKEMNRHYTKEQYLEKIDKIKKEIPGITLTTDIIVGFPTETTEDFKETLDIIRYVRYDSIFSFIYSRREGTPAAKLDFVLTDEEIHRNFNELLEVQNQICLEKNLEYKDRIETILVDGSSKTNKSLMSGRTDGGKIVNFKGSSDLCGKYVQVKITNPKQWSLEGELI